MNKIHYFLFILFICMIGVTACNDENSNHTDDNENSCTATSPECTADNKAYRICVNSVWSNPIPCEGTETCKAGKCTGEDVTSNLPCDKIGEQRCLSNTRVQVCGQDNYWQFTNCPKDIPYCDSEKNECTVPACDEGEVQCDDTKTLATCVNYEWHYDTCPEDKPLCKDKKCQVAPKECTPNEFKCDSNTLAALCDENGTWAYSTCTGDEFCHEGKCVLCKNGETKCGNNNQTLLTCEGGTWKSSNCPNDKPLCNNNKCQATSKECTPNEFKCDSNTSAALCDENGYWSYSTCTGDEFCHEGKCVLCKNGETKCSNDYRTLLTCERGTWKPSDCSSDSYCPVNAQTCEYLLIQEGANAGKTEWCEDGFSKCASSKDMYFCQTDGNIGRTTCWDGCDYALDGIGAACRDDDVMPCTIENAVSTTVDFYNTWVFHVPCAVCKKTTNGDLRWIPVDNSYCQVL